MTGIPYIGEILSIASAMLWGLSVVIFKKIGETISPIALNPFKNTFALILFIITIIIVGEPLIQPVVDAGESGFTAYDYLLLILSGVIGIGLADTLFLKSLNLLGASISAIVDCAYSPMVITFAYIMLGERLGPLQFVGAALIIAAILFTSFRLKNLPVGKKDFRLGVILAILAVSMMGFGVVLIKPVLNKVFDDSSKQLWIAGFRLLPGVISSGLIFLYYNRKTDLIAPFKNRSIWKLLIPASFIGTYLALIFWIAGMAMTQASVASVLNQTSTIWIFVFAWLFLKEPITMRRFISLLLAVVGVYLVFIGGM